jgi:hypothetical protein
LCSQEASYFSDCSVREAGFATCPVGEELQIMDGQLYPSLKVFIFSNLKIDHYY